MAFGQDVEPVSKPVRHVRQEEDDEVVEVDRFQECKDYVVVIVSLRSVVNI